MRSQSSDRASERGSITPLALGMVLMLFVVGGISIDLWRVVAARQDLQQRADAAATAGANAIDIAEYRRTGFLVLDHGFAEAAANEIIATPRTWDYTLVSGGVQDADGDGLEDDMVVILSRDVEFALLDVLRGGNESVSIQVEAVASPQRTGP